MNWSNGLRRYLKFRIPILSARLSQATVPSSRALSSCNRTDVSETSTQTRQQTNLHNVEQVVMPEQLISETTQAQKTKDKKVHLTVPLSTMDLGFYISAYIGTVSDI